LVDAANGAFGNAVVPQIAQWIAERIKAAITEIDGLKSGSRSTEHWE
jgi:hypothetical protein